MIILKIHYHHFPLLFGLTCTGFLARPFFWEWACSLDELPEACEERAGSQYIIEFEFS